MASRQRPYYKQLKCKFCLPAESLAKRSLSDFVGVENYSDEPLAHENDLFSCSTLICLKHLGYPIAIDVHKCLANANRVCLDYFCYPWWERLGIGPGIIDKHDNKRFLWYRMFSRGLFLSSLDCSTQSDYLRVCSWIDSKLSPEYLGEFFDDGLAVVYMGLAELALQKKIKGVKQRLSALEREGSSRCQELCKLIKYAFDDDNAGIEESLARCIETLPEAGELPEEWLGMEETIVYNLMSRREKGSVKLHESIEAFIVRPESIGLL